MNCITSKEIETPLGTMFAASVDGRVCMLAFSDDPRLQQKILRIEKYFDGIMQEGDCAVVSLLENKLNDYFSGSDPEMPVPLILCGTKFQQKVWTQLREISHGETWTYRSQAEKMGDGNKVRAVASANAANLLCIVIPCHRVIASNGKLSGYNGGLWRKEKLLQLEKSFHDRKISHQMTIEY